MAGFAVSWGSRKPTIIATSSCEAKYVAIIATCKEAVWLRRLLRDIPPISDVSKDIKVLADSHSAIKLPSNESSSTQNKYIDITYHYVRNGSKNGEVIFDYTSTTTMVTNMLNKPPGRVKFEKLRLLCGLTVNGEM